MRQIERVVAAALAGVVVSSTAAQDAVQWRVEDGGNGHWYQMATSTDESGIDDYRHAAESAGGNLASINTAEESLFVLGLLEGAFQSYVLGGIQLRTAEEPFGDWTWMDGSEWTYTNWLPGEPNDLGGSEDFLAANPDGRWNDVTAAVTLPRFAIEWSADCNGDGIVDYGQILDGAFSDDDGNGVPDCCDAGTPCVDGAVQWLVEDGGNGHWYQFELIESEFCPRAEYLPVTAARGAEPVSVLSESENDFLIALLPEFHPTYSSAILGCVRDEEGGWRWLSGETWGYTDWVGSQGNTQSEPTAVLYDDSSPYGPGWHDFPGECHDDTVPNGLIYEWSADCNGDGIVDYGQILDGTFADTDGNGVPDVCEVCLGDITGNGVVDAADLGILLAVWNTDGKSAPEADINGDGTVNAADLGILLGAWGVCL